MSTWVRSLRYDIGTRNNLVRHIFAEFLGTFIVVSFGAGGLAQAIYSNDYSSLYGAVVYGIAYMMGMYIAMGVTGGHLNPCVTLVELLQQKLSPIKAIGYVVAQLLGAFVANACVYGVYKDALDARESGDRAVPGYDAIFTSYVHPDSGVWTGFGDQLFASAILVVCYLAINDEENGAPPLGLRPFFVGLLYAAVGVSFSFNSGPGPSVNPAKDFAGRVFVTAAGWKKYPFTVHDNNWFWMPIISPLLGALCGLFLYQLFVGLHAPLTEEEERRAAESRHTVSLDRQQRMLQTSVLPGGAYGKPYPEDFGRGFPGRNSRF